MLTFHKTVRQRIGNVIVQYRLLNINEPVVITFPPGSDGLTEQEAREGTAPWSYNFFTKQHKNIISFTHIGKDEYYRSIELQNFVKYLGSNLTDFSERIGYGVSRGGFAVALHANTLKLDRALLMMPLSSYSAKVAPWDPKVLKAEKATQYCGYNNDGAECKTPLTIIYDPLFKADRLHMQRFRCEVHKLKISGVGHRIARTLRDLGLLKKIVLDFVDNKLDTENFPRLVKGRRELDFYHKTLCTNPTGKLTLKRKKVIYYHKVLWKLKHIEEEPRKIAKRLQESIQKRISAPQKLMLSSKNFIPAKMFVASNFFVFC
ncbi:hypothetical protein [Shewanella sp. UCD-KL12]|uniref:hypothetical protein n=1 Tax=Shewanella sp. UCD-KL12 TaxID=1917163 RepID=UPI0009709B69|nr:hypothetical protein [Shewanella sp. UCD-KL12]